MNIVITGATGFVGSALSRHLESQGNVVRVLRHYDFDLGKESVIVDAVSQSDIVINLAGAPINVRWTKANKREIKESRVNITEKIVRCINLCADKPSLFISVSAIGIYGYEGVKTESSSVTTHSFLAQVAREWEAEVCQVSSEVRCVILRLGVVLGKDGGMLKKLLKPYLWGIAAIPGDGRQPLSWIHIDDLVSIFDLVIYDKNISGVINCVAPLPSDMLHLSAILADRTRPYIHLHIPCFIFHLFLLQGAEIVLKGQSVISEKLSRLGFKYKYPDLHDAMQAELPS